MGGYIIAIAVLTIGTVTSIVLVNSNAVSSSATMHTTAERYLRELNYEQAIIEFQRIIEIDPMNADAYHAIMI